jgi:hypothetical protein
VSKRTIHPRNLAAQLLHRSVGNPVSTLPSTAISNCFPGLELDFRNLWRRIFEEITLEESSNYVVDASDPAYQDLVGRRLLLVDWQELVAPLTGPQAPAGDPVHLVTAANPAGVTFMEWSNALARVVHEKQGRPVLCHFTKDPSPNDAPIPRLKDGRLDESGVISRTLTVQHLFAPSAEGARQAVIAEALLAPGELTQGLCSPWQNDYRECACYYWAASRPDYVNVEPTAQAVSRGDNWMARERTGTYLLDDRKDSRLLSYDELFEKWQEVLSFQIEGKDAEVARPRPEDARPPAAKPGDGERGGHE